jgi:hypothetical protein
MSFTQDELQALNAIFDQKMAVLRRELERTFDQRMQTIRRDFEQQLATTLQETLRSLTRRTFEQQHKLRDGIQQRLSEQQESIIHAFNQVDGQRQQQVEAGVERALAAQLLAIEQLINQRFASSASDLPAVYTNQPQTNFDAIEVQTEIPWEDLIDLMNTALNERFATFNISLQDRLQDVVQEVLSQIQHLQDDLRKVQPASSSPDVHGTDREMQDILTSIDQLERIVDSMQVAMAANSTLIANRLYHHQRLPMERAHPSRSASLDEQNNTAERERSLSSMPPIETPE